MKLYGVPQSPFVRKVRIALEEKGIPYANEPLVPFPKTPELLALSPIGKIPFLRDGDVVVPDSSVICAYLEKKHPRPALYPSEPADYAKALFLEEYADTRLGQATLPLLFERFVKKLLQGEGPDEARVKVLLEQELPPAMDYLESQAPESGDSVLARFGIADIAIGTQLAILPGVGVEIDARRWPRVARYFHALLARPSFKTAMAE
jgi:glutathione S-transferase